MPKAWVLWRGPGHRVSTCVEVPGEWLVSYRKRVIDEWKGRIIAVYRKRSK